MFLQEYEVRQIVGRFSTGEVNETKEVGRVYLQVGIELPRTVGELLFTPTKSSFIADLYELGE